MMMRNRIEPSANDVRTTGRRSRGRLPRIARYGSGIVLALLIAACQQPIELSDQIEKAVNDANAGEQPPAAPSNLQATPAGGANQIDLSWQDNSDNEDEFQIARKKTAQSDWQTIDSVLADSTTFSDTGLDWETDYDYRVRAVNSEGTSSWSAIDSASTLSEPSSAPAAPESLAASAQSPVEVFLSWQDKSSNEEGFQLQRAQNPPNDWTLIRDEDDLGADQVDYLDIGLDSHTTYSYRVRAVNSEGSSNWSNVATDTTAQLAAPSGLTVTAVSGSEIDLTWVDNSNFESGFEIERDDRVIYTVSANTPYYRDIGLSSGTEYNYRIRAVDAGGGSPWSTSDSATTDYEIGDTGPAGGIIFYDDEEDDNYDIAGARYLEAAPPSTESFAEWGDYGYSVAGDARETGIGDGQAATDEVVAHMGNKLITDTAAQVADGLSHEEYTDWFLPSKDELVLMYQNLHQDNIGGFADDGYWSSSEYNPDRAWVKSFSNDFNPRYDLKLTPHRVRAVRAFGDEYESGGDGVSVRE